MIIPPKGQVTNDDDLLAQEVQGGRGSGKVKWRKGMDDHIILGHVI